LFKFTVIIFPHTNNGYLLCLALIRPIGRTSMQLSVTVKLADRSRARLLPATLDSQPLSAFAFGNRPLAAFVAQIMATYLRIPSTGARTHCPQSKLGRSYIAAPSPSLPETPTLDRTV
jgi:hypothetical protein